MIKMAMNILQVFKLRALLVLHLYCLTTTISYAFLFHQLQLLPSNNQENISSIYINNHHQHKPVTSGRAQGDLQISGHSSRDSSGSDVEIDDKTVVGCPVECNCNKVAQIADCSDRNLLRVPNGFPKDIKRIRLERNNITELGPYAFQNLKRLQRIDLSNNNLFKIDPLAFAGGLQSLNSLILYSNKLNQLPANLFNELSQLQLLLLNANSLQCVNKELFQSLTNLNLLSLYDNNIETLANGTFDGLKNIKTIHLGKNPLTCDCNLRWLADYLELNPIETSEARCEGPSRNQAKKLSQLSKQKFRCEGNEQSRTSQISNQCSSPVDQSCPVGCVCNGATVDCSQASLSETRTGGGIYELPDIPSDIPVYVTRMRFNDNRIKRIRQTGLFRRLANSQKLDLGNNKIIDIEDNAITGRPGGAKPERVVFVLMENDHCDASSPTAQSKHQLEQDACSLAPKVNSPNFDSPCYNGGSCVSSSTRSTLGSSYTNFSCFCPPGFIGPLCEINIDDCLEHQCQNGAMCVDGINSYRCVCRDPTTSGEFCEQLNSFSTSSANSIAPMALPMLARDNPDHRSLDPPQLSLSQQILARSADLFHIPVDLTTSCKRVTQRKYYDDGNGCQSVRMLKLSECGGTCESSGCCTVAKVKRRRIRMQCNDGASYIKTIDLVKKCACSAECSHNKLNQQQQQGLDMFNATQEDQILQITRLDAVD